MPDINAIIEDAQPINATIEDAQPINIQLGEVVEYIEGGGDKHYSQAFTFLSSVVVTHNLGKYPAVTIIDSAGDEVVGAVEHNNENQLTITFNAENTGTVFCN